MHRQWAAGYDVEPYCKICLDVRRDQCSGTLLHRHTVCECTQHAGIEPPPFIASLAAAAISSPLALVLADRCLVPLPILQKPRPDVPLEFWYEGAPEDLQGDMFLDGFVFERD